MSSKTYFTNYQERTDNEESNSQTKDSIKEDYKILGKKTKREENENKINNEFCSICRNGGELILCDDCIRSFHLECLKLNRDDIPEGNWFCPICTLKKEKKNDFNLLNSHEIDEKQRKRLIKNEKRRLWRRKKKEEMEAIKNRINNINPSVIGKNGKQELIDTILTNNGNIMNLHSRNGKSYLGVINRMSKLPLNNSKICLNITYSKLMEKEQKQNKSLSLPLLFPIPNNILKNFSEKKEDLFRSLGKRKITKFILENNNQENEDGNFNEKISKNEDELTYQKYKDLIKLNKNNIYNESETPIEISKILKLPNSIKALNNIIIENKDLLKYNSIMRDYWNFILEKKSSTSVNSKHLVKYPINSKELYSFPDYHGLDEKYFNKTEGVIYPYFNGKLFNRIINIYDFISTFSSRIYLNKFGIEELFVALLYSENYKKGEIFLLTSIHVSLIFLLICELGDIPLLDLYNKREIELIMLKVIVEYKKDDIKKIFSFIYYSWPELIRLFLISNTFNRNIDLNDTLLEKLYNIKDNLSYNTEINFDEKILILEKLIHICYETNFIRNVIKDEQDRKNEMKKKERELDEQLKDIESRKREMERQYQFTQPEMRIEEINKKLKNLPNKNKSESKKIKSKLEAEKEKFKALISNMNNINNERDEAIYKISNLRDEVNNSSINKSYLGKDGRSYKYYYFNWMENIIFMRVKLRNKNNNKNDENKYEWRIIVDKEILNNDLINKLSEKGIEELELKNKLNKIYKKMIPSKNKSDKLFCEKNIEDIFKNQALKYDNIKNPLRMDKLSKSTFISNNTNIYQLISEKIKAIEVNITKYLSLDNRQWESVSNRKKILLWISKINDIKQYVNLLLFFNERIKNPYKMEPINLDLAPLKSRANKKVLEDQDEEEKNTNSQMFDQNGCLDPQYINEKLQFSNRIRLWTKENESYNVEKIYLSYLRNVKNLQQFNLCLNLFEIAVNELNKRKEYYRKKEKVDAYDNKEKEDNNLDNNNNGEKRKTILKKKKLIDWNVECMFCHEYGDLLCCEECPNVAHFSCTKLKSVPDVWICPNCQNTK